VPAGRRARYPDEMTPASDDLRNALDKVIEYLDDAERILREVDSIGLWVKSDDCTDNRQRRRGLRDADWTVAGAVRKIASVRIPSVQPLIDALAKDLGELDQFLEPLPDLVSDIMDRNPDLDGKVGKALDEIGKLRDRARSLRSRI